MYVYLPAVVTCRGCFLNLKNSDSSSVEADSFHQIKVVGVCGQVGMHFLAGDVVSWTADANALHGKITKVHSRVQIVGSEGGIESLLGPDSSYGRVAVEDDDVAGWIVLKKRFGSAKATRTGADDEDVDHDGD